MGSLSSTPSHMTIAGSSGFSKCKGTNFFIKTNKTMKFITNLIKSILAVTLSCAVIIVLMPFAIFEASSGKETVLHRWANKCKKNSNN